jgi:hypothetical protein
MDFLSSLNGLMPTYETTLPFSKEQVVFTPFRVKDAKSISVILQEDNKKFALISMVELLKSNTKNIDIGSLCLADAEFLFLQIRSKSVDEQLNLIYNKEKIQVYIPSIQHRNAVRTENIKISNNFIVTLETPTIKELLKLPSIEKEDLLKAAIKKVTVGGEVYHVQKFVTDEIKTLLDNLPLSVMPKLEDFLKNQPELFITIKAGDEEKEVSGLLSFFTYR